LARGALFVLALSLIGGAAQRLLDGGSSGMAAQGAVPIARSTPWIESEVDNTHKVTNDTFSMRLLASRRKVVGGVIPGAITAIKLPDEIANCLGSGQERWNVVSMKDDWKTIFAFPQ
jgi:hypothetical protein